MYLMNHYLDKETTIAGQTVPVPDTDNIEQTNSVESIGQDADNCVAQHSQNPTASFYPCRSSCVLMPVQFILVDYCRLINTLVTSRLTTAHQMIEAMARSSVRSCIVSIVSLLTIA